MAIWFNIGFGVLLGGAFIAAAVRLWNREPAVLAPRTMVALLGLAFLPALVGSVAVGVVAVTEGEPRLLIPAVVPLLMLGLLLVFFRRVMGRAVVFNVDETSLYDALEGTLERHGLAHDEHRSTIDVAEHDARIDVNYQATTNSGTVNLRGDDQRELIPVLEDLRGALSGRKLETRSPLAVWYLVIGVLLALSQVGLLALRSL